MLNSVQQQRKKSICKNLTISLNFNFVYFVRRGWALSVEYCYFPSSPQLPITFCCLPFSCLLFLNMKIAQRQLMANFISICLIKVRNRITQIIKEKKFVIISIKSTIVAIKKIWLNKIARRTTQTMSRLKRNRRH